MIAAALVLAVAAAPAKNNGVSAVAAVQAPHARSVRLSTAEMFRLAEVATANGDSKTAEAIYAALEQNPDPDVRSEARFRRAKQLMQQNHNGDAAVLMRRILDDRPDAVGVRLELARLMEVLGESDAALRELRAAQALGLPPAVARMVDRYSDALRAVRPTGASFEVALAPDSNINRATRSDALGTIFGDFEIDEDSKAKSGIGLALRGQAYRRFALGNSDHNMLFRASGFADLYRKFSFNDIAADIAAGPELRLGSNRINVEIGVTQRWFGQKPFMRSVRVGTSWSNPLGRRTQVRFSAAASLGDNQLNDLQDGKAYSGQLALERALTPTTGIVLTLGADRQKLKDRGYSLTGWRGGMLVWKDIGRMTFTASGELGRVKADERLILFPERRSDRYSKLMLGATFRQLTFSGFAPIVRFAIERNQSSIAFHDFSRTRSDIGITRAF